MLQTGKLIETIIQNLNYFREEIKSNSKIGLNNQHIHAENFVKKILNIVFDLQLESLNDGTANFPGLDLGDKKNSIAFQITGDKSSKKINKTILNVLKEKHYLSYKQIMFFILSRKQKKYTLANNTSPHFHFDVNNHILDFDLLFGEIKNLEYKKLNNLSNLIEIELPYLSKNSNSFCSELPELIINIENDFKIDLTDEELEIYLMEIFHELKTSSSNFHKITIRQEYFIEEKLDTLNSQNKTIEVRKEIVELKSILVKLSDLKNEINEKIRIFYFSEKFPISTNYKLLVLALKEIINKLSYPHSLIDETTYKNYFKINTNKKAEKFNGNYKFDIFKDHLSGKRLGCSVWLTRKEIIQIKNKLSFFSNIKEEEFFSNYLLLFSFEEMDFDEKILSTKVLPSFVDRFFDFRNNHYNYISRNDFTSWTDLINYKVALG